MAHRYTIRELEEWSDYTMLYHIVNDRFGSTTNVYSPLSQRLEKLLKKLDSGTPLTKGSINNPKEWTDERRELEKRMERENKSNLGQGGWFKDRKGHRDASRKAQLTKRQNRRKRK